MDGILFKIKKPPEKGKAAALNIAGQWKGTASGPMGELEITVELEQEGNEISGIMSSNFGKWEISDGYLSGNELDFTISAEIMGESMEQLTEKAKEIRRLIFKTICNGGGGHIPASLSIVEILTVLYHEILRFGNSLDDPNRDRFILSKGHAGVALYAVLADKGFFDKRHLDTFGNKETILGGHPDMYKVPGVEASTGALGHGFPFGVGMALAAKMDKKERLDSSL